jgi:hypothetical protein
MRITKTRTALGVLAVLALALPAAGSAHPSMYLITGKIANHAETVTLTVDATGGTYKPSAGAKTIPWNAPSWMVEDALGADTESTLDPAIGRNATTSLPNVLVTGPAGGPYTLRFQGSLASTNVGTLVPNSAGLTGGTGTASVATVIDGTSTNTTYLTDPTGATLQDLPQQAVITNDGYVTMWTESNGMTDHGFLNLKFLPSGYRGSGAMTGLEWLSYPQVQTGIQTHATCQNVPALNTNANALAVQELFGQNPVGDPFWNFVPFQKTGVPNGVGGDDDPNKWIAVVQTATGVNLSSLNTVADFRTACEALNGGTGVYVPADTMGGSQASAQITNAVNAATAPLNAQIATLNGTITTLNGQIATLNGQVATLTADNATLNAQVTTLTNENLTLVAEKAQLEADLADSEAARLALVNRPLNVRLAAGRFTGKVVLMVTGPLSQNATLKLQLSKATAAKLGISRVLVSQTRGLGSMGAWLATLTPRKGAIHAIAKVKGGVNVTIVATSGALTDTASATLRG